MDTASRLVVLIACCFVNATAYALVIAFGALYVPLLDTFQEDRAQTATVQSFLLGVTLCAGIVFGVLSRRFGLSKVMFVGSVLVPVGFIASFFATSLYHLIITISILSGIGNSILHVCSSSAVACAFEGRSSGAAVAVHSCAVGVGTLAYPFLVDFLLRTYNVRELFLIFGGVFLNNIPVTLLIHYRYATVKGKRTGSQIMVTTDQSKENVKINIALFINAFRYTQNILSNMMNFRLGVLLIASGISFGCLGGFLVVAVDLFESKGLSSQESLDSFIVLNGCSIFGRLLPILFLLKKDVHPMAIFIVCSVFACTGLIVIFKANSVSLMFIGSGLTGIAVGGYVSGVTVAILYFTTKDMFETALGLKLTITGILVSAAGPLYGWIRDELEEYDVVIGLTAGMLGVSALLCVIAICFTKTSPEKADQCT